MRNKEPSGVGGWLLLFCFSQVLFLPLRAFQGILQIWERIGPHPFPVIRQMAIVIAIIILVMTAYGMIVGILIWKGDKRGRDLARRYLILRIVVVVTAFASITGWGYNNLGESGAKRMALAITPASVLEIGICLIWLGYFVFSKRVRNTYCGEIES